MIWSAGKHPNRVRTWALLPLLTCGCVGLMGKSPGPNEPPPPPGPPCQVVAMWEPQIRLAPDPIHGGANNAGLAGWVYLFGQDDGLPITGDGVLVIDLFDLTSPQPVRLEEWRFDKDSLKKLTRKDPRMGGWGYRLFLPWGTYKPTIAKVQLRVGYQTPLAPAPLFASEAPTTLIHPDPSALAMSPSPSMMKELPPLPAPAPMTPPANPMLPPPTPTGPTSAWGAAPPTSAWGTPPPSTAGMADLMRTMATPPATAPTTAPTTSPTPPVSPPPAPTSLPSQGWGAASPSTPQMTPAMAAAMADLMRTMATQHAAAARTSAPPPAPTATLTDVVVTPPQ